MIPYNDWGSSFHQWMASQHPHLLPAFAPETLRGRHDFLQVPHGTTVLALRCADGAVIAGDRRATEGYSIAERRIQKVHNVDRACVVAFAGAAGPCLELTRLFQIELEHYEKLEGAGLSMEGKANKLAQMVRGNLSMAMQGMVVVPILAGFDDQRGCGRIFKYDVAGGQYEELEYCSVGSGGKDARGTLKKIFKKDASREEAVRIAVEALYDAAEGDIATGGPDLIRGIFPTVKVIQTEGILDVSDDQIKNCVHEIVTRQTENR
jgi:proteasome beta subunit